MRPKFLPVALALAATACAGSGASVPDHGPHGDGRLAQQHAEPDAGIATPLPPDLAGADAALASGDYSLAARAYEALAAHATGEAHARAMLGLARTRFETADYDAATDAATEASSEPSVRDAAALLRAESLVARGKLDDAQATLTSLAAGPTAWRAKVRLGELLVMRGRRAEAQPQLMALIEAYNDERIDPHDGAAMASVAMASRALRSPHDANDAFQQAAEVAPNDADIQLAWAELFLEKSDAGHAEECVRDALRISGKSPRAHALAARVALAQGFDFARARSECDLALSIAPNQTACHTIRAGMALRDMDLAGADAEVARALATNPADLEALAVKAAIRFLADDAPGFDRAKRDALAIDPQYAGLYSVIAEHADWEHRYPEIVGMAREAIALDPDDSRGYATLGLNLLRMGDETNGLAALHDAWDRDQFDVQVFNTLNLYDETIARDYVSFDATPLVFRMHREERPMLEPYVVPVLRQAYADMVRRYAFTPQGPVHLELYANEGDFSVRTSGLPNIGVQGVCFGRVVTALSPRGGPFNWGNIVWHELSHVFHIQLSHGHVPRWFTEGLAEWETTVAHPDWGGRPAGAQPIDPAWRREDDESLWLAMQGGRLPAIRDMNQAFTHAHREDEILVAYYASSRIVTYIVDRFGFAVAPRMLAAWGRGERTEQVVQGVLGISVDQLDHDFREATRQRLADRASDWYVDVHSFDDLPRFQRAATAAPRDADAQAALAVALLVARRGPDALAAARAALRISPRQRVAHFLLATFAEHESNWPEVVAHTDALIADGADGYEIRLMRDEAAEARHDLAGAQAELDRATHIDHDRPEAWMKLAQLAHRASDENAELDALLKLVRIDQHSRELSARALQLLSARGRWADVVAVAELAIFLDPESEQVHRLLGRGYTETGHAAEGRRETEMADRIAHPAPVHAPPGPATHRRRPH